MERSETTATSVEELERSLRNGCDPHERISLLNRLSHKLLESDSKRAYETANEAIELAEQYADRRGLARGHLNLARYFRIVGQLDRFEATLEHARRLVDECAVRGDLEVMLLQERAISHHFKNEYAEAVVLYRRAIALSEQSDDRAEVGRSLELLGNTYRVLCDYSTSLEICLQSMAISMERGDEAGIARVTYHIGGIYRDLKEWERALTYFEQSLEINRRRGHHAGTATVLVAVCQMYIMKEEYEMALQYAFESLEILRSLGRKRQEASALLTIAIAYGYMEQFELCIHYHSLTREVNESIGDHLQCGYNTLGIAEVHLEIGEYDVAEEMIATGMRRVQETGYRGLDPFYYKISARLYEETGRYQKAVEFYRRHAEVQRELHGKETARKMALVQAQADIQKTERQKELFRLKSERLETEMEHKSRELASLASRITRQSEFMSSLREDVDAYIASSPCAARLAASVLAKIGEIERSDDRWELFERQFRQVHRDFLERMKEHAPTLTRAELKVCALIHVPLSTREAAEILCSSTRTIDNHRRSIRRKLGITPEIDLSEYIAAVAAGGDERMNGTTLQTPAESSRMAEQPSMPTSRPTLEEIERRLAGRCGTRERMLLLNALSAAVLESDPERGLRAADDALAIAVELDDQAAMARAHLDRADYFRTVGAIEEAERESIRAREIIERLDDAADLELRLYDLLVWLYEATGRYRDALDALKHHTRIHNEVEGREAGRRLALVETRAATERAEQEQEMFRVRAERLEAEMEHRSRDLTSLALHISQQFRFAEALRDEVVPYIGSRDPEAACLATLVLDRLTRLGEGEEQWEIFERQFRETHRGFLEGLTGHSPSLTPAELKVCALLRIGLSTKEAAEILCVSTRTIDNHRRSIRRKLGLAPDVDLLEHLASPSSGEAHLGSV